MAKLLILCMFIVCVTTAPTHAQIRNRPDISWPIVMEVEYIQNEKPSRDDAERLLKKRQEVESATSPETKAKAKKKLEQFQKQLERKLGKIISGRLTFWTGRSNDPFAPSSIAKVFLYQGKDRDGLFRRDITIKVYLPPKLKATVKASVGDAMTFSMSKLGNKQAGRVRLSRGGLYYTDSKIKLSQLPDWWPDAPTDWKPIWRKIDYATTTKSNVTLHYVNSEFKRGRNRINFELKNNGDHTIMLYKLWIRLLDRDGDIVDGRSFARLQLESKANAELYVIVSQTVADSFAKGELSVDSFKTIQKQP